MVPIPDRLEQAVRESQGEDIVDRFLSEEVIDPEYLRLLEDLVHLLGELDARRAVNPERLLNDHARILSQLGLAEQADHGSECRRWHGKVEEPSWFAPDGFLGLVHRI